MSNPKIEVEIELIPVIRQDKKTGYYVANFSKFPRAIASAETAEQAVSELMHVFSDMLKDKKDEIIAEIVKEYREVNNSLNRNKFEKLTDVRVHA